MDENRLGTDHPRSHGDGSQKNRLDDAERANRDLRDKLAALEQKELYLRVLNDCAGSLLRQTTVDEIVWDVAKNAIARLGFEDCVIYLMDDACENLVQRAAHGPKNPREFDILNPILIPVGKGIVGSVARTGRMTNVPDTRKDDRYLVGLDLQSGERVGAITMKEKEPIFQVDALVNRVYYFEGKTRLIGYDFPSM